jgi:hypothetical protein
MIEPEEIESTIQTTLYVDGDRIIYIRAFGVNWIKKAGAIQTMNPSVTLIKKKKRKTYCRVPKENIWRRSKKYGTTITIAEKDNVLNTIMRNPKITSKTIQEDTTIAMHKVLAIIDLMKEEKMILKSNNEDGTPVYTFQP